ncbi:alpha/beta-hydrolase [Trametes punicea]|nr:alpha/beta-hydrolase [Trametes punicea]
MSLTEEDRNFARNKRRDLVKLPSGTTLEYVLLESSALHAGDVFEQPKKLAICLHPWSWLGGRMNDPVLETVTEPLLERGYDVLRYNSRGVGNSKGWPSLTGSREVEDLKELIHWAMSMIPNLSKLVILGYSHGSLIASMQPALVNVETAHIILSYPLGPRQWLTAFHAHRYATALESLVDHPKSNVLIIYGDKDEFTSVESYDSWAKTLQDHHAERQRSRTQQGRLEIVKVEGASHFWREPEALRRLTQVVKDWVP